MIIANMIKVYFVIRWFYIQKGLVTIIPWRKDNKNSKQLRAYKDCLQRAKTYGYGWLGFIDSDEFVVLLENLKILRLSL